MKKIFFLAGLITAGVTACSNVSEPQTQLNLIGSWKIEYIMGQPTVDYNPAQINFDADGRLTGNNSCNNFFGTYTQQGNKLTLNPGGNTMKACVEALMAQEQLVTQAMPMVKTTAMKAGRLELSGDQGQVMLILTKL